MLRCCILWRVSSSSSPFKPWIYLFHSLEPWMVSYTRPAIADTKETHGWCAGSLQGKDWLQRSAPTKTWLGRSDSPLPTSILRGEIPYKNAFQLKTFWNRSLPHSMFFTSNIEEFVYSTSLPENFDLKAFSSQIEPHNLTCLGIGVKGGATFLPGVCLGRTPHSGVQRHCLINPEVSRVTTRKPGS